MTELRDARLRKALEEAPDARLQPHHRTRAAIRAAAHAAVQPAWRRWWTRAAAHPAPWTAALASVALATVITVLWQDREPPGASPELPVERQAAAPAASPPAAPAAPAAAPQAAPTAPAAQAPEAQAPAAPAARPAPPARARPKPAPLPQRQAADALATAGPESGEVQLRDAAPAAAQTARPPPEPAAAAPAAAPAPPPPPPSAPAPTPTTAVAPAPAAAPRQAIPPPAAGLRAASAALPWTQVRIESEGRSVVVPRPRAGELPALVTSLLVSTSDDADTSATASLRLELAEGDQPLGVLELVGERWRWTPLREAAPPRWLRADPALAARLRASAQQLLR